MEQAREAKCEPALFLRSLPAEWREIFQVRRLCSSEFCFTLTDILFSHTSQTVPCNHFCKVYFRVISRVTFCFLFFSHHLDCFWVHFTCIPLCTSSHVRSPLCLCNLFLHSAGLRRATGVDPISNNSPVKSVSNGALPSGYSGQPESDGQSLPTWTVVR